MKKYLAAFLMFFIVLLPGFLKSDESDEEQATAQCCFTHDRYQGNCVATPGEGETCESILEYLNTPGTVGKTYCNNTKWRGGWTQVNCEK
jgi:hypothetical protein